MTQQDNEIIGRHFAMLSLSIMFIAISAMLFAIVKFGVVGQIITFFRG